MTEGEHTLLCLLTFQHSYTHVHACSHAVDPFACMRACVLQVCTLSSRQQRGGLGVKAVVLSGLCCECSWEAAQSAGLREG